MGHEPYVGVYRRYSLEQIAEACKKGSWGVEVFGTRAVSFVKRLRAGIRPYAP